jgi:hypothetical protein
MNFTVGRTPRAGDQTSKPRVEIEPTIPVSERVKIFRTLNHAAIVIGNILSVIFNYLIKLFTMYYFSFLIFSPEARVRFPALTEKKI